MNKKDNYFLAINVIFLFFILVLIYGCNGTENEVIEQYCNDSNQYYHYNYKGITYVSWTKGDYPYSTPWKAQDWIDSQAIQNVYISSDMTFSGNGSLAIEANLIGQDENKHKGETFIDMRYNPPVCPTPDCITTPINLSGIKITAKVYCPDKSKGDSSAPNGIQLFVKDDNWKSFYGNWVNIEEDSWNLIFVTPSETQPSLGYMEPGFNPEKIISLGLKIAINGDSNNTFNGIFYLDDITWGSGCNPKYGFENTDNSLDIIKDTGANSVALITAWYMDTLTSNEISRDSGKSHTNDEIKETIDYIQSQGLEVLLKPHIEIKTEEWRGEITPTDMEEWWKSYKNFIKNFAQIAKEKDIKIFCIGTELKSMSGKDYMSEWASIIDCIKNDIEYQGELIYAANHDEYQSVSFWEEVDKIGINAYFILSKNDNPTVEELTKNWKYHLEVIENWQTTVQKCIIFTEVGYSSHSGAAKKPWLPCDNNSIVSECNDYEYDAELQEKCYEATFTALKDKSWFEGMFWWAWYTNSDAGGECDRSFTPQNKLAEELLRTYY